MTDADEQSRMAAARDSYSGRTLTESQFQKAWALAGVFNDEIRRTGSFIEPLTDYAHAYARAEKFDALRGETILRDLYKERFGETMNQTREGLLAAEAALPDIAKTRALDCAEAIGELIRKAPTQPFYKAYDRAAVSLSAELKITQVAAKALMKDAYEAHHGRDLYEVGKALEKEHHLPVREAEIAARKAETAERAREGQTIRRAPTR